MRNDRLKIEKKTLTGKHEVETVTEKCKPFHISHFPLV